MQTMKDPTIEAILLQIPDKTTIDGAESEELRPLLAFMKACTEEAGLTISFDRMLVIGIHLLAFIRRVKQGEWLPELEEGMFDEVSPQWVELSRRVLTSYVVPRKRILDDAEVFYLTVHLEAAQFHEEE
ncbi:PRD domain-containing protein [Paenibacillus frigoriresistens]|uniref:PRD domain-containing protein n=1 Tax=Paenibacillus alginolyticus TaxID=59839 RepID=UPI0015642FA8|nr:PRD domain-containing protein [Paenibacillus frigoriresistens]NRF95849.1 PRD domain-containing protein [Paenibacillus frigoriresistens]